MIAATLRHKELISIMLRGRKLSFWMEKIIHHRNKLTTDAQNPESGQTLLHIVTFQGTFFSVSWVKKNLPEGSINCKIFVPI